MQNDTKALNNAVRRLSLKLKHDMQKQIQEPIIEMNILDEMMQQEAMKMDQDPQAYKPSSKMQENFQEFVKQFILEQNHAQESELVLNNTDYDISDFS